jgi:hypothetical protein
MRILLPALLLIACSGGSDEDISDPNVFTYSCNTYNCVDPVFDENNTCFWFCTDYQGIEGTGLIVDFVEGDDGCYEPVVGFSDGDCPGD